MLLVRKLEVSYPLIVHNATVFQPLIIIIRSYECAASDCSTYISYRANLVPVWVHSRKSCLYKSHLIRFYASVWMTGPVPVVSQVSSFVNKRRQFRLELFYPFALGGSLVVSHPWCWGWVCDKNTNCVWLRLMVSIKPGLQHPPG